MWGKINIKLFYNHENYLFHVIQIIAGFVLFRNTYSLPELSFPFTLLLCILWRWHESPGNMNSPSEICGSAPGLFWVCCGTSRAPFFTLASLHLEKEYKKRREVCTMLEKVKSVLCLRKSTSLKKCLQQFLNFLFRQNWLMYLIINFFNYLWIWNQMFVSLCKWFFRKSKPSPWGPWNMDHFMAMLSVESLI